MLIPERFREDFSEWESGISGQVTSSVDVCVFGCRWLTCSLLSQTSVCNTAATKLEGSVSKLIGLVFLDLYARSKVRG